MRGKRGICLVLFFSLLTGILAVPGRSEAKTVLAESAVNMYCDGRYVYYTGESSEPPIGIMRLNTKTGKVKKIFSHRYKGKETNGFKSIMVRGNYIYVMWDHTYGSEDFTTYIYRIRKDGKEAKKLAVGCEPKMVGNRIYYTKCKLQTNPYDGMEYTEEVGEASMKLDGSGKRMEHGVKYSIEDSSAVSFEVLWGKNKKDAATGNNFYYMEDGSRKLMRLNLKSGKRNTVYKSKNGEEIERVTAHKNAVIIHIKCKTTYEKGKYIDQKNIYVNQEGKKKVLLRKTNYCN